MKKWQKLVMFALIALVSMSLVAVMLSAYYFADATLRPAPYDVRRSRSCLESQAPASEYQEVSLHTSDGLNIYALYRPPQNGASVILLHGYKSTCANMLPIAEILTRHGYGVILPDLRGHGKSEGERITFGRDEMYDLDAVYQYLIEQPEVDANKIGILGNSMGSAIMLLYSARNPQMRAVVAQSPYTRIDDLVVATTRRVDNVLVAPMAPLVLFFMRLKLGVDMQTLTPLAHIGEISPRPVFILMGGQDKMLDPDGGQRLYEAAGEPREYWYDPDLGHLEFHLKRSAEFERRVVQFFDRYLGQE